MFEYQKASDLCLKMKSDKTEERPHCRSKLDQQN